MSNWRALQIRFRLEAIANDALLEQNIETFFPRRIIRMHRRGSPFNERPYFPGYLFADLENHHFRKIMDIKGVAAIIPGEPIPPRIIDELKDRADENGIIIDPLRPGAQYRLVRPGIFGRMLVRLEDVDEKQQVRVLLRLLGCDRPAFFSVSDLGEEVAT